jgi:uncharacterized protein RhaS with RHS repeats
LYDSEVGRFLVVDPLGDRAPGWTPFRYGFNNPVLFIDPDGLFESKDAAREYAKDNNIKLGLFSGNRIRKQDDGFAIISNLPDEGFLGSGGETFIKNYGGDIGVVAGVTITPNDIVGRSEHLLTFEFHHRDGSIDAFDRPMIGVPGGGAVKGGIALLGHAGKNTFAASAGFKSFSAFKRAMGSAGNSNAWHHVVEQHADNLARFGAENIHNTNNLIKLPNGAGSIHAKVSGYYSSKQAFTGGQTVRQWLRSQSYQQQYDFGIKTLNQFGWIP